jgi:hypothetical protein
VSPYMLFGGNLACCLECLLTKTWSCSPDGDEGMVPGACPNRAESQPMNFTGNSLVLQNFFRTDPIELDSCKDDSDDLYKQLPVCYTASADRWANYLAVDFYKVTSIVISCMDFGMFSLGLLIYALSMSCKM